MCLSYIQRTSYTHNFSIVIKKTNIEKSKSQIEGTNHRLGKYSTKYLMIILTHLRVNCVAFKYNILHIIKNTCCSRRKRIMNTVKLIVIIGPYTDNTKFGF